MKTALAILAALSLSTSVAHAQPAAQVGPPPTFKFVTSVNKEKGLIVFRETLCRTVPVTEVIEMIVNGETVKKTVTKYVNVMEERMVQINAANSRIITPNGKQVPIDEVWNRVKAKSVVLVSADGNTPSEVYLRALHADTLVLIPPLPKNEPIPMPKKE